MTVKTLIIIWIGILMLFLGCQGEYKQGRVLYQSYCANCHMDDGSGLGQAIPGLSQERILSLGADIACLIRHGQEKEGVMVMTAHPQLTHTEITNIINYIRSSFAQSEDFLRPANVQSALDGCPKTSIPDESN